MIKMEEEVGFEPTDPFEPLVFKTRAIDHSTTLPLLVLCSTLQVELWSQSERHPSREGEAVLPQREATLCILVDDQGFEPRSL